MCINHCVDYSKYIFHSPAALPRFLDHCLVSSVSFLQVPPSNCDYDCDLPVSRESTNPAMYHWSVLFASLGCDWLPCLRNALEIRFCCHSCKLAN